MVNKLGGCKNLAKRDTFVIGKVYNILIVDIPKVPWENIMIKSLAQVHGSSLGWQYRIGWQPKID